ncbi:hypothetical protein BFS06_13710 [Clostridium perfringens]|nr:hypothetical protein BFS06_13710 [Clostridium perfringens]
MGNVFSGIKRFLGFDEFEDEYDEGFLPSEYDEEYLDTPKVSSNKKRNNLVNIGGGVKNSTIKLVKPKTFEESADYVDFLRTNVTVIINTTDLEKKTAQRLLDFIGGACYSLGANFTHFEKGVFIASPATVEVSQEEIKDKMNPKENKNVI